MPYLFFSAFLLFAAYPLIGTTMAVWVLAGSQLALLSGQMQKRQVSGAGAFIFMSFLFFGVRPIYIIIENDYKLFRALFLVPVDLTEVGDSMWWASGGMLCFAIGAFVAPLMFRHWILRRRARARVQTLQQLVGPKISNGLLLFQVMTLPVMYILARSGRGLYGSAFGAYAYDLPVPLQSVHIITVVVLLERYLRTKTSASLGMLCFSVFLFLDFSWLMRDVSLFRGFYIAGVMIVGIAALQRIKGRVGFVWLIIPIVGLQPFFQYLGQTRGAKNEKLAETGILEQAIGNRTLAEAYWRFYEADGDMNIFDTFVAGKVTEPAFKPYLWSWLYVPLHFVPRALWPGKPERGTTMDLSYTRGAPYSAGIAGLFVRDGGLVWMLACMTVLGFLLALLDVWVFTLPRGYLQNCLIGIVTVNAMFLTRFFLWQYFYQMLYAMVPVVALAWFFGRDALGTHARRRLAAAAALKSQH